MFHLQFIIDMLFLTVRKANKRLLAKYDGSIAGKGAGCLRHIQEEAGPECK